MSTQDPYAQFRNEPKPGILEKLKNFWSKHDEKFILAVGIVLIAGISFEAGFLRGQKNEQEDQQIVVNRTECPPQVAGETITPEDKTPVAEVTASASAEPSNTSSADQNENQISQEKQNCAFVASKNSNKYHLPSCRWAERIKKENQICFSSREEAESRGYQPCGTCLK